MNYFKEYKKRNRLTIKDIETQLGIPRRTWWGWQAKGRSKRTPPIWVNRLLDLIEKTILQKSNHP